MNFKIKELKTQANLAVSNWYASAQSEILQMRTITQYAKISGSGFIKNLLII
jgi:hypothetical protein